MPRVPKPLSEPTSLQGSMSPAQIDIGVAKGIGQAGRAMGDQLAALGAAFGDLATAAATANDDQAAADYKLDILKGQDAIYDDVTSRATVDDPSPWMEAPTQAQELYKSAGERHLSRIGNPKLRRELEQWGATNQYRYGRKLGQDAEGAFVANYDKKVEGGLGVLAGRIDSVNMDEPGSIETLGKAYEDAVGVARDLIYTQNNARGYTEQMKAEKYSAAVAGLLGRAMGRLPAEQRLQLQEQIEAGRVKEIGEPGSDRGQSGPVKIYDDSRVPSPAERAQIRKAGGIVINLDTNSAGPDKQTRPMVVIPDNATPDQRRAAEEYAREIAGVYKQKFGSSLEPVVVTRSQNGRGRSDTIHTEPFSVNDTKAADFFTSEQGRRIHADIIGRTLGKIPGAVFSLPHDVQGKGDTGAVGPRGSEVQLAKILVGELRSRGLSQKEATKVAQVVQEMSPEDQQAAIQAVTEGTGGEEVLAAAQSALPGRMNLGGPKEDAPNPRMVAEANNYIGGTRAFSGDAEVEKKRLLALEVLSKTEGDNLAGGLKFELEELRKKYPASAPELQQPPTLAQRPLQAVPGAPPDEESIPTVSDAPADSSPQLQGEPQLVRGSPVEAAYGVGGTEDPQGNRVPVPGAGQTEEPTQVTTRRPANDNFAKFMEGRGELEPGQVFEIQTANGKFRIRSEDLNAVDRKALKKIWKQTSELHAAERQRETLESQQMMTQHVDALKRGYMGAEGYDPEKLRQVMERTPAGRRAWFNHEQNVKKWAAINEVTLDVHDLGDAAIEDRINNIRFDADLTPEEKDVAVSRIQKASRLRSTDPVLSAMRSQALKGEWDAIRAEPDAKKRAIATFELAIKHQNEVSPGVPPRVLTVEAAGKWRDQVMPYLDGKDGGKAWVAFGERLKKEYGPVIAPMILNDIAEHGKKMTPDERAQVRDMAARVAQPEKVDAGTQSADRRTMYNLSGERFRKEQMGKLLDEARIKLAAPDAPKINGRAPSPPTEDKIVALVREYNEGDKTKKAAVTKLWNDLYNGGKPGYAEKIILRMNALELDQGRKYLRSPAANNYRR